MRPVTFLTFRQHCLTRVVEVVTRGLISFVLEGAPSVNIIGRSARFGYHAGSYQDRLRGAVDRNLVESCKKSSPRCPWGAGAGRSS